MLLKDLCLVSGLLCQLTTQNKFSGGMVYCENADVTSVTAALEIAATVHLLRHDSFLSSVAF